MFFTYVLISIIVGFLAGSWLVAQYNGKGPSAGFTGMIIGFCIIPCLIVASGILLCVSSGAHFAQLAFCFLVSFEAGFITKGIRG